MTQNLTSIKEEELVDSQMKTTLSPRIGSHNTANAENKKDEEQFDFGSDEDDSSNLRR